MLVLTRKLQEKIRIGDQVTITVLRMKGKAVRLGIEAPLDVPVIRGELVFEQTPTAAATPAGNQVGEMAVADSTTIPACVSPTGAMESRKDRAATQWPRDSHPHLSIGRVRGEEPQAEVTFARVPREKAAQFLGRPASAKGGPLRSMLDERSKAV